MPSSIIGTITNTLSHNTTEIILRGSILAVCMLSVLFGIYDIFTGSTWLSSNALVYASIILYLLITEVLYARNKRTAVNWMLVIFYQLLGLLSLLNWGLSEPLGILCVGFAILLPSILMGARFIPTITLGSVFLLTTIYLVHTFTPLSPYLSFLTQRPAHWSLIIYSTALAILALISWISASQKEHSLAAAIKAETALQTQKETLAQELEKESAALRHTQLLQVRELHKFALLGQSAAATMHELSNHLSILNLDIDDLTQQDNNSQAIANAKESINYINKMVRQARQQLNSYDRQQAFNALPVIKQAMQDLQDKFTHRKVRLIKTRPARRAQFTITGSPLALNHAITILLNNAIDACDSVEKPRVSVSVKCTSKELAISVLDNGKGISKEAERTLFKPTASSKPTGLGVGLYIARHIIEDHFGGSLRLVPNKSGTNFVITLTK